jgi:hypothetical protein
VFSKARFKNLLSQYTLVQLHTDKVPPIYPEATTAEENKKFEQERFGTLQLPLYVILKPLGGGKFDEVGRYVEGKINNEDAFAKFLEEPLNPRIADLRVRANGN